MKLFLMFDLGRSPSGSQTVRENHSHGPASDTIGIHGLALASISIPSAVHGHYQQIQWLTNIPCWHPGQHLGAPENDRPFKHIKLEIAGTRELTCFPHRQRHACDFSIDEDALIPSGGLGVVIKSVTGENIL